MSAPNDETARSFHVVSDGFIDAESDDADVSFHVEGGLDNEIEKGGEGDGTGDENRDDHSEDVHDLVKKKLKTLKSLGENDNCEIKERIEFFQQLFGLIQDWIVQLPDLNSIFQQEQMDFLLIQATILNDYTGPEFIQFVVRNGYKDRFDVPEDGKDKPLVLRRTTAIHHAARNKPYNWEGIVEDLFEIYDRFDVNYVDDFGLTHFHVACMTWNCQDSVQKFLEQGLVDPNLIWPETGDSPLHLSVRHDCGESAEILIRNGADPNLVNKDGSTPLHLSTSHSSLAPIELLFEVCEDMEQTLQVNARDNLGNTPLHLALSCGFLDSFMVLLRNGADPNLANKDGLTPLHLICKRSSNFYNHTMDIFFEISDEMNQLVQVDPRDKLGRTPLQWAVANIKPYTVESLLNHGADLSSFVLLPEDDFTARFDPNKDNSIYFKLGTASGALAILESLEKRGYKVEDYALIIMKIFSRLGLFKESTYVQTRWYDDEKFATEAKRIKILPWISRDFTVGYHHDNSEFMRAEIETAMTPSLSLYDLIRLRPEEATKILPYRVYYDLDRSKKLRMLPRNYYEDVMVHLYEKVPRGFCRRWALKYFYELIRYRLPILCCEIIIDQLRNEDLGNICFAATGQDPY